MDKLCVFAGTTEGRKLVGLLSGAHLPVTVCVATDYGQALLDQGENITVSAQPLTQEEMEALLRGEAFSLVIDATHPYADKASQAIQEACRRTGTEYLRLRREEGDLPPDAVFLESAAQAADYLNTTDGAILLTTGSKDLMAYARIRDFARRAYVRVLPAEASLAACREAGVKPAHILAMQGPFSQEMNLAMLRAVSARYLVTKDGGGPGGFGEKAAAARQAGAQLVVVGRPPQGEGLGLAQVVSLLQARFSLPQTPVVTVAGIGPGGPGGMTGAVAAAVEAADCLLGAPRMLAAVARPGQTALPLISPEEIAAYIAAHPEHRRFVVVLSGDVGFFSGAKKLLPRLAQWDVEVLPGLSSLAYLCAKLGTSYEDVVCVSLHGRTRDIGADVAAHPRVFVLVGGPGGINALCAALVEAGLGHVTVSVGQRLSYPEETITVGRAEALLDGDYAPLSVALIENPTPSRVVTHGLPDEAFLRGDEGAKVPMTKSEVRSVCLSKLGLTALSLCWDVGAGTGSVALEMALQAGHGQVYAVERDPKALALLRANREKFGLSNLTIVAGQAPEACQDLPAPTHVFVGGSDGRLAEILALARRKNPTVRVVATAISLESAARLTDCLQDPAWETAEVVSLSVARSKVAGRHHLMLGQNPIFIVTLQAREGQS